MCRDIGRVDVFRDLEFDGADVDVTAERPEVGLLHAVDAGQAGDLLVALLQGVVQRGRLPLHEHGHRLPDQTEHAEGDQQRDEYGADGVGPHPAEQVHQDGGDDDADRAKRVGENVEENASHDVRVVPGKLFSGHFDAVRVAVMGAAV